VVTRVVYRLELDVAAARSMPTWSSRGGVDVDVHILSGGLAGTSVCRGGGWRARPPRVGPEVVYIVVDSPAETGEGE